MAFTRIISLCMLLVLTGCGVDEMRWQEEVWLHDDSRILVDRYSTIGSSGFPNDRRGSIRVQEFRYLPLKVEWKVKGAGEQLASFDIIDGVPYLVAVLSVTKEKYCQEREPGEYIAVYYTWEDGIKKKIPFSEVPISMMRNNVTGISHWGYDSRSDRGFLSWYDVLLATHQSGPPPMLLTEMFAKKSWLHC